MKNLPKSSCLQALLLLPTLLLNQGCGSIEANEPGHPYSHGIYRGTRYDASWFAGKPTWLGHESVELDIILSPVMIVDLALCLVMDTIMLPADLLIKETPENKEMRLARERNEAQWKMAKAQQQARDVREAQRQKELRHEQYLEDIRAAGRDAAAQGRKKRDEGVSSKKKTKEVAGAAATSGEGKTPLADYDGTMTADGLKGYGWRNVPGAWYEVVDHWTERMLAPHELVHRYRLWGGEGEGGAIPKPNFVDTSVKVDIYSFSTQLGGKTAEVQVWRWHVERSLLPREYVKAYEATLSESERDLYRETWHAATRALLEHRNKAFRGTRIFCERRDLDSLLRQYGYTEYRMGEKETHPVLY